MKCQQMERQISKRLWTKQEDEILLEVIRNQTDIKWANVAQQFNIRALQLQEGRSLMSAPRSNKQCRERWQNHLNPQLKNHLPWSKEQHNYLFELFKEYSHQWCIIGNKLEEGGYAKRGDNNIKNYFYSAIKRVIKTINEFVKDHNKQIKKKKSQLYNHHQKYAYKKRLSLQREILGVTPVQQQAAQLNKTVNSEQMSDLKIVKQLDQQIVNKILLIAEWKGDKKFIVSSIDYHKNACDLRNQLIEFVQDETLMNKEKVVRWTQNMLEISRRCKRKTSSKNDWTQNQPFQEIADIQKDMRVKFKKEEKIVKEEELESQELQKNNQNVEQCKPQQTYKMTDLNQAEPFDQKRVLSHFLVQDKDIPIQPIQFNKKTSEGVSPRVNGEQLNMFQHSNLTPNIEFKTYLDQSSEYLYNSGCYSQKFGIAYGYDQPIFGFGADNRNNGLQSLNFGQMLESQDNKFQSMVSQQPDFKSNMAEFNFINSIKQVKPKQDLMQSQALDFDFQPFGSNFMPPSMFRFDNNAEHPQNNQPNNQRQFFSSQHYLLNNNRENASHRSGHSRHTKKSIEGDAGAVGGSMLDLLTSHQLLNRSWAYSQNRAEQRQALFNSNNYQARKQQFQIDNKNSNFHPFDPQQ